MTQIDVSDRALRLLCAVANHGSFTAAAAALGLGQPAVSHAIARLERSMQTTLVVRSRTGVSLTAAGTALVDALEPAYDTIDRAVAGAGESSETGVSLSVSTSLAAWWLLPRLPEFKRRHRDIGLRIVTADDDQVPDPDSIDLWVPLGVIDDVRYESHLLCEERLVPVGSPQLATELAIERPVDLLQCPLLHLEERYRPRFDWARWFGMHGVAATELRGDRSNDYSLVIQAALDGQGVALGWWHIVRDLVEEGRLVTVADPLVTDRPFEVLQRRDRMLSDDARILRDWLISAMGGSTPS